MNYFVARGYAREMRKKPTHAEKRFWEYVRGKKFMGLKFNRQFVLEYQDEFENSRYYIPDFHCHAKKLIVELDGEIHAYQMKEDQIRENNLRQFGFHVIRFTNKEVLNDIENVLKRLEDFVNRI